MSAADAILGWVYVNAALLLLGLLGAVLWSQYEQQRARYEARKYQREQTRAAIDRMISEATDEWRATYLHRKEDA